ncbi:transglycosylase SLT domain-containing protein [bacterium]|nr:transglycosylase SLT domain-containing protein [bacterium]
MAVLSLREIGEEGEEAALLEEVADSQPESAVEQPKADSFRFLRTAWHLSTLTAKAILRGGLLTGKVVLGYLRYHPLHALLTVLLIALLAIMVVTSTTIHSDIILNEISDETVEDLIEASRFTRGYSSVRLAQIGERELLRVGAPPWVQREGVRAILYHARKAGLSLEDQAVLLATAEIESGFNPLARASTTSACGLFQFVKATGTAFDLSPSDCMSPFQNAKAGIQHYVKNHKNSVEEHVSHLQGAEKAFKTFELSYYLHHDGPHSKNPSNDVKAVVLNGTTFLFRAYSILRKENLSKAEAPSFLDRFTENLFGILHQITEYIPLLSASEVQASEMISPESGHPG